MWEQSFHGGKLFKGSNSTVKIYVTLGYLPLNHETDYLFWLFVFYFYLIFLNGQKEADHKIKKEHKKERKETEESCEWN